MDSMPSVSFTAVFYFYQTVHMLLEPSKLQEMDISKPLISQTQTWVDTTTAK